MRSLAFIFFLLLGFYIFGLLVKLIFRIWLVSRTKQFRQGGGASYRTYTRNTGGGNVRGRRPEGAVTIEHNATPPRRINRDVGDYVAYEEIK